MPHSIGNIDNHVLSVATSGSITPSLGTVGIGTPIPSGSTFLSNIETSTSYEKVMEKFESLPPTPNISASFVPPLSEGILNNVGGNASDWTAPSTSQVILESSPRNIPLPVSTTQEALDLIPVHKMPSMYYKK